MQPLGSFQIFQCYFHETQFCKSLSRCSHCWHWLPQSGGIFCLPFGDKTLLQSLAWNKEIACWKNRLSAFICMTFVTGLRQMKHLRGMKLVWLFFFPFLLRDRRMLFSFTHTYICVHTYMYVHNDHLRLNIYKLTSVFGFYCWWILLNQKC